MTRTDDRAEDRATTVGLALPGTEVRIVDLDGATVPTGTTGELCTRGYHVMTGYFDDPEATASAIDADGWLHTGDLASMDDRGYLSIEGRLKEMIIRGGENLFPRDRERAADPSRRGGRRRRAHPRRRLGRAGRRRDPARRGRAAGDRRAVRVLAANKEPRYWAFVEQFPLTGSGKVQKYALREQVMADDTLQAVGTPSS